MDAYHLDPVEPLATLRRPKTDVGGEGSAWTFEQRLTPTLTESESNAGWSVSVSGDVIVVGTFYSLVSKAYVYRFDGDSWVRRRNSR